MGIVTFLTCTMGIMYIVFHPLLKVRNSKLFQLVHSAFQNEGNSNKLEVTD